MIGTFSHGIQRLRLLPIALGAKIVPVRGGFRKNSAQAIIGWGLKENTRKPTAYATKRNLPYLTLEDGFIRSIGLGVSGCEPFGFVIDKTGIYYDATRPSDLENLIIAQHKVDTQRVRTAIEKITAARISKYNHTWSSVLLPDDDRPKILLIDQTYDDLSVHCGLANNQSFAHMLAAARGMYPQGRFYVKTHPDVLAGRKRGYLTNSLPEDVTVIGVDCNPMGLMDQVDHVFTVTSQMGFEALLLGKPVSCFGIPFYAGWGLTDDHVHCARRKVQRSLEAVFDAAYGQYTRYVDPIEEKRCSLERIVDFVAEHARVASHDTENMYCFGFRFWKRGIIRRFVNGRRGQIRFVSRIGERSIRKIDPASRVLVWGLNDDVNARKLSASLGTKIERVEDGFIRSVGLGSDFSKPSSLIHDRQGIYFDPRQPSDLEDLLNQVQLDDDKLARARALQDRIVRAGINKYNSGKKEELVIGAAPGQQIILVPGQVEDDASIDAGGVDIKTNQGLLEAVRTQQPDDYIIYKPHPDVLAGNRKGHIPAETALHYCDQIVTDCNMHHCLKRVDQVHTITSLTGFEALLLGKRVCTYGLPFYAGWSLTTDRHRIGRRRRSLSLEELVYCTLIEYPRYYNWQFNCFVSAEDNVRWLEVQSRKHDELISTAPLQHWLRKLRYLIEDMQIGWAN